jgi:hypothetical protein
MIFGVISFIFILLYIIKISNIRDDESINTDLMSNPGLGPKNFQHGRESSITGSNIDFNRKTQVRKEVTIKVKFISLPI